MMLKGKKGCSWEGNWSESRDQCAPPDHRHAREMPPHQMQKERRSRKKHDRPSSIDQAWAAFLQATKSHSDGTCTASASTQLLHRHHSTLVRPSRPTRGGHKPPDASNGAVSRHRAPPAPHERNRPRPGDHPRRQPSPLSNRIAAPTPTPAPAPQHAAH